MAVLQFPQYQSKTIVNHVNLYVYTVYCICILILNRLHLVPVLHGQKKNLRRYWKFFFVQTLLNCTNNKNTSSKNFNSFFFICFFGGPLNPVLAGTK